MPRPKTLTSNYPVLRINIVEDFPLLSKVRIMLGTEYDPAVRFREVNDV